jgi:anti-sigma regulatory factor (Ser/Thr protein kinase)
VILLATANEELTLKFQSDITFVDVAVEIIRNILHYLAVEDPTNVLLVSRELLKNAVVHGNQNDRTKEVVYRLSRSAADQFRLEVEDSGAGFGQEKKRGTGKDKRQNDGWIKKSSHGFAIINSLCRQVVLDETEGKVTVLLAP